MRTKNVRQPLGELRDATRNRVKIHQMVNFDNGVSEAPDVSLVVPVCNVEQFVAECLQSIIEQTHSNIEVICVNDGSPDGSLAILLDYADRDQRVRVVDKENAGYGHTMNLGMDLARGEFIAIVESDDYIRPTMVADLLRAARDHELDFVKSDFYRFTTGVMATRLYYHALTQDQSLYNRVLHPLDSPLLFRFTNTWTGLYRRSFLESNLIRHQETPGASYQDNGFWFLTTSAAERLMYLEQPYYMNRRDNPNSSVFNDKKLYAGNSEYEYIERCLAINPERAATYAQLLLKKKLDTYNYNYTRVSPELKWEYLQVCSADLATAMEGVELDPDLFTKGDIAKLTRIVEDPERYHRENGSTALRGFTGQHDDGEIPIAFIADENYAMAASVAITSLVASRKKSTKYHISVICSEVSDFSIKKLTQSAGPGARVEILALEVNRVRDLHPTTLTNFGVPPTALIKFHLPSILSDHDKVLYLDDDVLVRRDLAELFETELGSNLAGVVADMPQVLYEKQAFGEQYGRNYFNSGVLLLNLAQMRAEGTEARLIETKRTLESKLMDQDVLNHVFGERVVHLPIRYNTLILNLTRSEGRYTVEQINQRFGTRYRRLEDIRDDSAIVHFCSKEKPWKFFDVAMADEWISWLARSPYSGTRLRRESVVSPRSGVVSNGFYSFADESDSEAAVVLWVDRMSIPTTVRVIRSVERHHATGAPDVVVFHASLRDEEVQEIQGASSSLKVEVMDLTRLIEREVRVLRGATLPNGYFKLLAAEVLPQYRSVLVLDGAYPDGTTAEAFASCGEQQGASVSLINSRVRFLSAGAMVLNVRTVLAYGLKARFLEQLGVRGGVKRGPAASMHSALKGLPVRALDVEELDTDRHDRSVLRQDLMDEIARLTDRVAAAEKRLGSKISASSASTIGGGAAASPLELIELVEKAETVRQVEAKNRREQLGVSGSSAATSASHRGRQLAQDKSYEDGIAKVRASTPYRIGHAITYLPGLLRRSVRSLKKAE